MISVPDLVYIYLLQKRLFGPRPMQRCPPLDTMQCNTTPPPKSMQPRFQAHQTSGPGGFSGPRPPAHHPESCQYLFSAVATSTARAIFRRSRCRSAWPFASKCGLETEDPVGDDEVEVLSHSAEGEEERVEETVVGEREYVGEMLPRIRPAVKTQVPTAWRIRESPAKLPMMKTSRVTSREDSALARRVRAEIRGDGEVSSRGALSTSERSCGHRKSREPLLPTTYSKPPTVRLIVSPDARRILTVAEILSSGHDTDSTSALASPS
jgi:hypothetical protein